MSLSNIIEVSFSQNRYGDPKALYAFDNGYGVSSVLEYPGTYDERLNVAILKTGPKPTCLSHHPSYKSFAEESGSDDVLWTDGVLQIYGHNKGQLFAEFLRKVSQMNLPVSKNAGQRRRRRRRRTSLR